MTNKGLLGAFIIVILIFACAVIFVVTAVSNSNDISSCLENGYDYKIVRIVYCIGVRDGNTIVIPASELGK